MIELHRQNIRGYESEDNLERATKEYKALDRIGKYLSRLKLLEKVNGKYRPVTLPDISSAGKAGVAAQEAAEKFYQQGLELMRSPGQAHEAVALFKKANKLVPDFKDSRAQSAEAYYLDALAILDDDKREAIYLFREAQKMIPDYKDTADLIEQAIIEGRQRIAIMPFENNSGKYQYGNIGETLSDETVAYCVSLNPELLEILTREYVYSLLQEQDFAQSGRVDVSTAPNIGKLLGIQAFVFGKVNSVTANYPPVKKMHGTRAARGL